MRAVTADPSVDLGGIVQELIVYDNPIYTALERHLRGEPAHPYDANHGRVIAEASRVAEPLLAPALRVLVKDLRPKRVLDLGCGSGIYLRHVLEAAPAAIAVGIDSDTAAAQIARRELQEFALLGRCEVHEADISTITAELGQFDMVLLLNNIYYWAPGDRSDLLRRVSRLLGPAGHLIVASATPAGPAFNRHLDVILRVTAGSFRLPSSEELQRHLGAAGLQDVTVIEPVPRSGLALATGTQP
jgi:SAM-dependent methyltransferase